MTLEDIKGLLPELVKAKVSRFKNGELEIEFHVEPTIEAGKSTEQVIEALKKQEEQLPVDLRTDNISSYDSILNWSASPDQTKEIPGTGDQPL